MATTFIGGVKMKRVLFCLIFVLFTVSQVSAGLDKDLVVFFTFENVKGKKILDTSDNDLDAEVVGNIDFVKGKYGNAMHIAAAAKDDTCVHVPADDLLKIEDEITMMAWVHHEDWETVFGSCLDKGSRILAQERNRSYGIGFFDGLFESKGADIGMILGGGQMTWTFITNGPVVNKSWHHITGTYDGRTRRIYLDGKIHSEGEENFAFMGTNDFDLRIGCAAGDPPYIFKNGSIDEVGVWQRALTQSEIEAVMKGALAVSPKDKIATTWGSIKHSVWKN